MAHKWSGWLHNTCRLGGPQCFKAAHRISSRPTSGPGGYITNAAWGVTNAAERGTESEVAHKWARWLHDPCRPGVLKCFRAEDRTRSGPQMGRVAT